MHTSVLYAHLHPTHCLHIYSSTLKLKQWVMPRVLSEIVLNKDVMSNVHCVNVTLNVQRRRKFWWKLNVISGEQCVINRAINRCWSIVYWRELESPSDKTRLIEPAWTLLDKRVITANRLINCFLLQVNLHFYMFGAWRAKVDFPMWLKARSHRPTSAR